MTRELEFRLNAMLCDNDMAVVVVKTFSEANLLKNEMYKKLKKDCFKIWIKKILREEGS